MGETENIDSLRQEYSAYLDLLGNSGSSYPASKLLNRRLVKYLSSRFYRCSSTLQVRILMSLLYAPPEIIEEAREPLKELLIDCETEADDWVRKLARLLLPYASTGHLDIREVDTEVAYRCIKYLDDEKKRGAKSYKLHPPLEWARVFDATEDEWPPADALGGSKVHPGSKKTSVESHRARLPPYSYDAKSFSTTFDFASFMHDIEARGLTAIGKEVKNYELQQKKRQQRAAAGNCPPHQ